MKSNIPSPSDLNRWMPHRMAFTVVVLLSAPSRDFTGGADEGQPQGGHRAWIGEAGGRQRVGNRQRRQPRRGAAGQQGDTEQHRPPGRTAHRRGDSHRASVLPTSGHLAPGLTRNEFALVELLLRDRAHPIHVAEYLPQFTQERFAASGQIGTRFEQPLIGGDLTRGGEQQRRHRFDVADIVHLR